MTTVNPPKQALPQRFDELTAIFPPLAIQGDSQHEQAVEMIDQLMRISDLAPDQKQYLDSLSLLVETHERAIIR